MAPNLNVVLGREELPDSVVERWKRRYAFEGFLFLFLDFPDADFVVLVSGEKLTTENGYGLNGTVGGCCKNVVIRGKSVFSVSPYLTAGGSAVEKLTVECEAEDCGGVTVDGGYNLLLLELL